VALASLVDAPKNASIFRKITKTKVTTETFVFLSVFDCEPANQKFLFFSLFSLNSEKKTPRKEHSTKMFPAYG